MNRKKRRSWSWLRYRKNDVAHNVLVAVQRWIHANNGTAVVLGGIGVSPAAGVTGKYEVVIGALGIAPYKRDRSAQREQQSEQRD